MAIFFFIVQTNAINYTPFFRQCLIILICFFLVITDVQ